MRVRVALLTTVVLAGCSHQEAAAPPPPPAPAPVVAYAPLPQFATPGMVIPGRRPDGSYPTPNEGLSAAAALWHVRAAINVAALSCPGEQGARLTAAYNAWIAAAKTPLAAAHKTLSKAPGFDDTMTRVYNYYAQLPARPAFCAAAGAAAASLADPDAAIATAPATVAALDQPFVDFYAAYDAWRAHEPLIQPTAPALVVASARAQDKTITHAAAPRIALAVATPPVALASVQPTRTAFHRIEIDPSVFRE